jgi:hypothetical protein
MYHKYICNEILCFNTVFLEPVGWRDKDKSKLAVVIISIESTCCLNCLKSTQLSPHRCHLLPDEIH